MSDHNLVKNVLLAQNFKLAEVLLDNLDANEILKRIPNSYQNDPFIELGFFDNKESFNFLIDYFYSRKHQKLLKKAFNKPKYLSNIVDLSSQRNFLRLSNLIQDKWWISGMFEAFKEAISSNNIFITKFILKIIKDRGMDLKEIVISGNFEYCLLENFKNQKSGYKILKLLDQETNLIGNSVLKASPRLFLNKGEFKILILRIVKVFRIKEIKYFEDVVAKSLADKKLFFYLYKRVKSCDKEEFLKIDSVSNILILIKLVSRSYIEVDRDVLKFLLKQNLKVINKLI